MDLKLFLIGLIITSSVAYLYLALFLNNRIWKYILKPGTMLCIIVLVLYTSELQTSFSQFVLFALLLSLAGDIFLMLEDKWFIYGLISFLLAHIIYIVGFLTSWTIIFTISVPILFVALLSSVFFIVLYRSVYKQGGSQLVVSVAIYMVIISSMLSLALLTGSKLLIAAALLFFISDAVLAFNKFYANFKMADYIVMGTYFSAQLLFAISVGGQQ